jgi:O-antigen ligase
MREWLPILVAAPVLMFPLQFPIVTGVIGGAVAAWTAVGWWRDRSTARPRTWRGWMLACGLVVAITAAIGTVVSDYPRFSIPKFCGVLLGVMILRAVIRSAVDERRIRILTAVYLVAGIATVAAGTLTSPTWMRKFNTLHSAAMAIPRVVAGLPGAEQGVNPNALGGTTLFFLPLLAVLAVRPAAPGGWERAATVTGLIFVTAILLLSQSRTAWISVTIGIAAMASLRSRPIAIVTATAAIAIGIYAVWVGPAALLDTIHLRFSTIVGYVVPENRTAIWSRAWAEIQAHPLTGVGLGAFREVMQGLKVPGTATPILVPHAHNQFLQVALDLGLIGLSAYCGMLVIATGAALRTLRAGARSTGAIAMGLWGSLVALHAFGLTDAIVLGAKPGFFFWWNAGLLAAMSDLAARRPAHDIHVAGTN